MIPGLSGVKAKVPEGMMEGQEEKIAKWEHIIKSMTQEEKDNPELLEKQTSRIFACCPMVQELAQVMFVLY